MSRYLNYDYKVAVEYDSRDGRTTKQFKSSTEGKRFYTKMAMEGRNPKIVSATAKLAND